MCCFMKTRYDNNNNNVYINCIGPDGADWINPAQDSNERRFI